MARELKETRMLFSKSIVLKNKLPASTILQKKHLVFKKPGFGMAPARLPDVLGRRLARDMQADDILFEKDLR